ncbi:MAG: hypothetical protein GWN07_24715, partial [Actinobacteria bacterium]|nr:hypothetical protein [Actinomycetota bacterium]NIS34751.1 hypothetical protein [Actinomycetota bacterium]NIX22854.1 hypothetical protein [Actinomycetota bacterium]
MAGSVRVTSKGAADEADMLDPFADMPDADVDAAPLEPESTQVLADDDLETVDDDPASVEVSIDELDEAEAEAIRAAAAEATADPPAPPDDDFDATDTVPGVALDELGEVVDEVGIVDDPNDDEPELTITEGEDDDEPELTVSESDELDLDEAE